ncbi:head maturation protease, ClpP-related [Agrobacterium tumefaciens]|uniref:head maturation protease, ClpP-related n=1 Tax=Agrobacterium tumefaciens TaxID=358 RepID=UPI0021CF22AB|nr:head maturation protease, ClpP-related [Agrobacterium tumefaciens]UXS00826.1 Clp protease ClpP [Agrobacterium tumefaciens]
MSLRALPELHCPDGVTGSVHLTEKALQMYRPMEMPRAAAVDGSDVITVLDVIGYDWWTGEGVTSKRISGALRQIGDKPVTVLINSPGGDFFEGVTIYNLLRAHPAKVTVQILGIAASAASVIAMAGDEVQIAKLGFVMVHNTQWVAAGDRHVMYETGDIMKVFDETCAEMYADRTGQEISDIQKMLDAETWLGGQGAVDKGFADKVADFDIETSSVSNSKPALYRLEAALASGKPLPRSERRKLIKEISEGMPGAAPQNVMPSADDDAIDRLRLAAARLSLTRA